MTPALKARRLLPALAAAALFFYALGAVPKNYSPYGHHLDEFSDCGELILHKVRINDAFENGRLPLASLTAATLSYHAGPRAWPAWRLASAGLAFLLILACGRLVGSFPGALTALAVLMLSVRLPGIATPWWYGGYDYSQSFYTLLVLLAAGAAIRRARAPSPARDWMLAISLGATFLDRSALVFFPPVLLFWVWFTGKPRRRLQLREVAALGLTPYLFLLPWIFMNWRVHHAFIPLENGPSNPLVALAALGHAVRHNALERRELIDVPLNIYDGSRSTGGALLLWALKEILRHPLRYAWSCLLRVRYVLGLNPVLILLGLAGLSLSRRDRGAQAAAALALYLAAIHCLMATKAEYFEPLWPLLTLLTVPLWDALARRRDGDGPSRRLAVDLLRAWFGVVVLSCALVVYAVSSYALRAGTVSLDQAVARNPDDAWLRAERGKEEAASGDFPKAEADLSRSLRLRPGHPQRELLLAWVKLMEGDGGAAYRTWRSGRTIDSEDADSHLFAAHAELKLGQGAASRAELEAAFAALGVTDPRDPRMSASAGDPLGWVESWDRRWLGRSPAEHLLFLNELIAAAPDSGELWIERTRLQLQLDRPRAARASLARALAAGPGSPDATLTAVLAEVGKRPGLELLEDLDRWPAQTAGEWIDRADLEDSLGERGAALNSFARALDHAPSADQSRRIALYFQDAGQNRRALRILSRLAAQSPRDAALLSDKGVSEFLNGDKDGAAKDLETALRLDPRLLASYLSLGCVYAAQGRAADALRIYETGLAVPRRDGDDALRALLLKSEADSSARGATRSPRPRG